MNNILGDIVDKLDNALEDMNKNIQNKRMNISH